MTMHTLMALATTVALVFLVAQHRRLARALRRRQGPAPDGLRHPTLTIVRPIRGLDVGARENLVALLASEYPSELEILCVLDDTDDEAYPLVRELVDAHRAAHPLAQARVLLAGSPPHGRTGKLHAMGVGVRAATGELIGFSDSDTRLEPDQLRRMADRLLASDAAGAVFAPALAAGPLRTIGDAGYAIMLNTWYGAVAAAASADSHELPFIMGQLMIFRRRALFDIGGVECADGQLVDDMYLGQRLWARGWHNVMSEQPLRIVEGRLGFADFMSLMRRWLLFARSGLPWSFKLPSWMRGIAIAVAFTAFVMACYAGWLATMLLGAVTIVLACWSDARLHRLFGGAPMPLALAWVTLLVPLVGPWALASLAFNHHVAWRGRDYALDAGAHLQS